MSLQLMIMGKSFLLFVFWSLTFVSVGAQSKYDVYVKKGCGNCELAKKMLPATSKQILFHSVDSPAIGLEMLSKLHKLKYEGGILMPVIIMNDTVLLHPAQIIGGQPQSPSLPEVLQSILSWNDLKMDAHDRAEVIHADCGYNHPKTIYYLVCGNFQSKEQAEHMVLVLRNRGYKSAGYIFYGEMFRTYSHAFNELSEAESTLLDVKKNYRGTYILPEELQ